MAYFLGRWAIIDVQEQKYIESYETKVKAFNRLETIRSQGDTKKYGVVPISKETLEQLKAAAIAQP